MQRDYDDVLDEPDTVDDLLEVATTLAEQLAEDHFEKCYGFDICQACARENPVRSPIGPWVKERDQFEAFGDAVEARVAALGGDLTQHNETLDEDLHWVVGELRGTYLEAFDDAAATPADCIVCTGEVGRDDDPCGHEVDGDTCPAA